MTINPAWVGRSVDETVRTLQALQTGKHVRQDGGQAVGPFNHDI